MAGAEDVSGAGAGAAAAGDRRPSGPAAAQSGPAAARGCRGESAGAAEEEEMAGQGSGMGPRRCGLPRPGAGREGGRAGEGPGGAGPGPGGEPWTEGLGAPRGQGGGRSAVRARGRAGRRRRAWRRRRGPRGAGSALIPLCAWSVLFSPCSSARALASLVVWQHVRCAQQRQALGPPRALTYPMACEPGCGAAPALLWPCSPHLAWASGRNSAKNSRAFSPLLARGNDSPFCK